MYREPRGEIVIGVELGAAGRDAVALGERLAEALDTGTEVVRPPTDAAASGHLRARNLQSAAERGRASLIVISAGGGPLHRVGPRLLQGAPCAIAVAPTGYADRKWWLGRIGVAFDGSPEAWAALETGAALAARAGASLTALAVVEPPSGPFSEALDAAAAGEVSDAVERETHSILDLAAARVPESVDYEPHLERGPVAERIVEESRDLDLLVLGSRGYGSLRRTFLGSVSRSVLAGTSCPTIVLPRAAGTDPLGVRRPAEAGA